MAIRVFRFADLNQKGLITFCLLGIMALGAVQYLGALYGVFSFGLRLRGEEGQIAQLSEEATMLELKVQQTVTDFALVHKELLSSMEKNSEVRYLTGESVAVSHISTQP
jgi:hypothetical protein